MFLNPPLTELELSGIDRITISSKYIKHGEKSDCSQCPIALALFNQYRRTCKVNFSCTIINHVRYSNSPRLTLWITHFDVNREVEPIRLLVDHIERTIDVYDP